MVIEVNIIATVPLVTWPSQVEVAVHLRNILFLSFSFEVLNFSKNKLSLIWKFSIAQL